MMREGVKAVAAAPRMLRGLRIRKRTPPGAAPGTISIDPKAPKPHIHVIAYNKNEVVEREVERVSDLDEFLNDWPTVWINVDGLGDADVLREIAERFGLHRLALEDVVNVHQRAKVEPYDDQLYIVARMITREPRIDQEQVSIFLGEGYVLSFQERPGDCFDRVRQRIRKGSGRIRQAGADYLAYALLDAITDAYFPCLEVYGDELEEIESSVIQRPDLQVMQRVYAIKRELLSLRRAAWPMREAMNVLIREDSHFVTEETRIYLRDVYDHAIQIIDVVETFRELAASQMDLYLSAVGQRTNEIMKVLTIFAAIFIPLTFIAGIYGMNFDSGASRWNMPELEWRFGYPAVLFVMLATAAGLLWYFRRKGWIGGGSRSRRDERKD